VLSSHTAFMVALRPVLELATAEDTVGAWNTELDGGSCPGDGVPDDKAHRRCLPRSSLTRISSPTSVKLDGVQLVGRERPSCCSAGYPRQSRV
jgi:hypothetical protein